MKLLADENVDRDLVHMLRAAGHEVSYVAEMEPGIADADVLQLANDLAALLLTEDKDFGELVFRQHRVHTGVVLLRMDGASSSVAAEIISVALDKHAAELAGSFTVLSPGQVRIRKAL